MKNGILIVDDNKFFRDLLSILLKKITDKCKIYTASNGKTALDIINNGEKNIQVVLTDITMPEMDGLDLVEHLLKENHFERSRILILTGEDSEIFPISLKYIGLDAKRDFLLKAKLNKMIYKLINKLEYNGIHCKDTKKEDNVSLNLVN